LAKKKAKKKKKVAKKKVAAKTPTPKKEKKYPDMVTIALHGDVANEIQAYMAKHEIKGAELLRRAFALLKAKTK
jgi:hypothetical protein